MEEIKEIDGATFAGMISSAASRLKARKNEINDLNVFPIPDGDTGDNMLLTVLGGVGALEGAPREIGNAARCCADGMLLSARGNSGVILSQFFDGIADGLCGIESADCYALSKSFLRGVERAYEAVGEPCEGTVLTVARCASESVAEKDFDGISGLLEAFVYEAKRTLAKTPDMLPVLKKAGVVDSGGAGLVCIGEGMLSGLRGDGELLAFEGDVSIEQTKLDISLFDENSELEFGYCTELLVRLQNSKCDAENFDVGIIIEKLSEIGDSLVVFKTGTVVKIHVHTKTPDEVLEFCRRFGEFLKVKIENMSLQHNNSVFASKSDKDKTNAENANAEIGKERKRYGVVAVANGDGMKKIFTERGADFTVDGGQTSNPSAEDFLKSFDAVNADTVFVFPNNSNIIMAAKQAAKMYEKSDVRVIESRSVGEGFAALSMFNSELSDPDEAERELCDAMEGVLTLCVSKSVRDTAETVKGDYIGISGKEILSSSPSRAECAKELLKKAHAERFDVAVVIFGEDTPQSDAEKFSACIEREFGIEPYTVDGGQGVYDYIIILE